MLQLKHQKMHETMHCEISIKHIFTGFFATFYHNGQLSTKPRNAKKVLQKPAVFSQKSRETCPEFRIILGSFFQVGHHAQGCDNIQLTQKEASKRNQRVHVQLSLAKIVSRMVPILFKITVIVQSLNSIKQHWSPSSPMTRWLLKPGQSCQSPISS